VLDPAFLQKLARLGLVTKKRAASSRAGERKSIRRGQSQEFADHRPYVPGDDLRFLDWHLLGRLDTLWVKLFEEEEDRVVQLLLDASASMEGEKLSFARKVAAAMGYVALGRTDRVAVAGLSDQLVKYAPPRRGRGSAAGVFQTLEGIHPGGTTDLAKAVDGLPRNRGAAISVLISDLLYDGPIEPPLLRLKARSSELFVLHVLSPLDLRPDLSGDVVLIDRETNEQILVSVDDATLDRYEATVHAWASEIEQACKRIGAVYARVPTTVDLEELILKDLRRLGMVG
jgi:uncharacterized protein (DUF58 family)